MQVWIYHNTPRGPSLSAGIVLSQPLCGIWWCTADVLVAVVDPVAIPSAGPRIDSDLAHADVWPVVAKHFGRSPSSEYFETPRGRVQLVGLAGAGVVLGGRATSNAQVEAIARVFGLAEWRVELDDHYATGADADKLFDQEF
jgi:hypothetical protein